MLQVYISRHSQVLLPTRSEQYDVLRFGSIYEGIQHTKILVHSWLATDKKYHRGSIQATIHPLAIILTPALWPLVSMIALGIVVN